MKISPATAPVWINANASFKCFDGRITRYLSSQLPLAYWQYNQELDEPSSLNIALDLLHHYLQSRTQPVDLIGHSTGGLLGLLYARKYPEKVRSLTLLGVAFNPAIDWQTHYYRLRKLLPCSQEILLARIVKMMFGNQSRRNVLDLIKILKQDLYSTPTSHSLYHLERVDSGAVSMPLMVCGSDNDGIIDRPTLDSWQGHLKETDVFWTSPSGHHFFHYFFPKETGRQVIKFWQEIEAKSIDSSLIARVLSN